jgi:transcriptional regulator GlxA family with amidase domain
MPMIEVTDQVAELGALSNDLERELLSVSQDLSSLGQKRAAVASALIVHLLRGAHNSSAVRLAARLVKSAGLISVDQLASEAGISSRQLERRFLREVGVGPKLLSRILRFQQVFRAVERFDAAWASIALECGYYDQAHLIRDFHQFAHQTPSVLFAEQSALTESFTRKTRTSHFSNTSS